MPFSIFPTTAEDIIGATDAALQCLDGVNAAFVAGFLDCPVDNANNALLMAEQLGLLANQDTVFHAKNPFASYLITSSLSQKAAILRLMLEQYEPYRSFKTRLQVTGSANLAANQVRAIHVMDAHRGDVLSTLVSLGTYTSSLVSEGAGRYRLSENGVTDYLVILNDVINQRENTESYIRRKIGNDAAVWINQQEVLSHLVTAYQRLIDVNIDPRAPIVHAGNAIESFLVQIAHHYNINIVGANGINAKTDRIAQGNQLSEKHKFILKYIGHIRNAADHGTDIAIGQEWSICTDTAIQVVHVSLTIIRDLVARIQNNSFIV